MPYLSSRALEGLKQYQYKPGGYTLLDDLHQPFWNYLTSCLPLWLAPNLITLSGIAGLVVAYAVSAVYLPEFEGDAPRWVYFLSGFAGLLYLHLDCLDGKQARRTHTSSPLGQLFDHGCDALSVHLILATFAATLGLGPGWKNTASQLLVMGPWLLSHWEEYHTGCMVYGNGYWGVTEANYLINIIHWVTAAFGPAIYQTPVWKVLSPVLPASLLQHIPVKALALTVNDVVLIVIIGGAISTASGQFYRVSRFRASELPVKERGHKRRGLPHELWQLAQFGALFLGGGLMMLEQDMAPGQTRGVMATFGIIYALQASRLIMAHMAKEPFEMAFWPFAIMAAVIGNQKYHWLDPLFAAWLTAAVVVAGYLHYVVNVVNEICAFLNIKCLTIKNRSS